MKINELLYYVFIGIAFTASGAANAALIGRDLDGDLATFEAYFDTDLNVTWLADANVNGRMTWAQANTWTAT